MENEYYTSILSSNTKEKSKERKLKIDVGRKVDKEAIQKLYNDYKTRKFNEKKLIGKIDQERGYTFKPKLNSPPKYLSKSKDKYK